MLQQHTFKPCPGLPVFPFISADFQGLRQCCGYVLFQGTQIYGPDCHHSVGYVIIGPMRPRFRYNQLKLLCLDGLFFHLKGHFSGQLDNFFKSFR